MMNEDSSSGILDTDKRILFKEILTSNDINELHYIDKNSRRQINLSGQRNERNTSEYFTDCEDTRLLSLQDMKSPQDNWVR